MDALGTVRQVLRWAADPAGAPPIGPLTGVRGLAAPDGETLAALGDLTSATAARLGAGDPPFGDAEPVGLGALCLAAAVGGRREEQAGALAALAPRLTGRDWAESVARHGIVAPALAHLAPPPGVGAAAEADLTEAVLRTSPLTMVLYRPATDAVAAARSAALRLLDRSRGAAVLVGALAAPSPDPAVLSWRGTLLDQLRGDRLAVMLDVYLAARLWYGAAWDAQIGQARRELLGLGRPGDLAIATLRYWAPLAAADRDEEAAKGLAPAIATPNRRRPGPGEVIEARVFLRREDYLPVVTLAGRYRSILNPGGAA